MDPMQATLDCGRNTQYMMAFVIRTPRKQDVLQISLVAQDNYTTTGLENTNQTRGKLVEWGGWRETALRIEMLYIKIVLWRENKDMI